MRLSWLVLLVGALSLAPLACTSGDDGDDDNDNDDSSAGDADSDADGDADSDSDTDVGSFDECVAGVGEGGTQVTYGAADEGGVIKHSWMDSNQTMQLNVEIYASYGAPTQPGTYEIDATEADYATCGLCILLWADGGNTVYMPVAGSGSITIDDMTLSSPVGTPFAGSFDVVLQEVTIADQTWETTPVSGGCSGQLSYSWTGTVEDFPQ